MLSGISKNSGGLSGVDVLTSHNNNLGGGVGFSPGSSSPGHNTNLTQGSAISHEVSVGTDPMGSIGVTVRASSPKDINRRQHTTTSEYADALSEKFLSEIVLNEKLVAPDSDDSRRSNDYVSTPMSYLLGGDMSDELGNAAGDRSLVSGMDDNSVNSANSVGHSSVRSAETNASSHLTLASNAVTSYLLESQSGVVE